MATQTILFPFLTGSTPVVRLFADDGSDTILDTPSATEATNRDGVFSFTQTDRAAGTYLITVTGGDNNAVYVVTLTLTTATFWAYERPTIAEQQAGLLTTSTFSSTVETIPESVADYVWDDLVSSHIAAGSTGEALYRTLAIKTKTDNLPSDPADQSAVEAAITAATSGLATASSIVSLTTKVDTLDDYVDTEVAAIKAKTDNLPADPADASDIAASFVTVNSKLDAIDDYVDAEVAAIKVVTDRLSGMLVQDGLVYQYTTNALENAPSGGGGGGTTTIAVYPLNATMPARVYDLNLTFYKNEDGTVVGPIAVTSRNADVFEPVDLSGRTLSVRFVDYEGTELLTVADSDITVSGADDNQISFPVTTDLTGSVTELPQDQWHIWTLRDLTNGDNVLISGRARVLLS
jgi:hypothetical protein